MVGLSVSRILFFAFRVSSLPATARYKVQVRLNAIVLGGSRVKFLLFDLLPQIRWHDLWEPLQQRFCSRRSMRAISLTANLLNVNWNDCLVSSWLISDITSK